MNEQDSRRGFTVHGDVRAWRRLFKEIEMSANEKLQGFVLYISQGNNRFYTFRLVQFGRLPSSAEIAGRAMICSREASGQ